MSIAPTLFPEIEGPEFIEGPGLAAVAEEVLHRHGAAGGIGRLFNVRGAIRDEQVRVLYLINTKPFNPLQDDITHDAIAKTVKAPRLWHDVTGYDAVIWARSYFWGQFDENQQAAVALHELLHLEVEFDDDNQPKLRLRKHDVEVAPALAGERPAAEGQARVHRLGRHDARARAPAVHAHRRRPDSRRARRGRQAADALGRGLAMTREWLEAVLGVVAIAVVAFVAFVVVPILAAAP